MTPINSCTTTDDVLLSLREKYGLTEEYERDYPEDFPQVLALIQSHESVIQSSKERAVSSEKLFKRIEELVESSRELHEQVRSSEKESIQALQKLAKSSSEMKEITSNLANMVSACANRIFNPVRSGWNHFYFLTGHRTPVEVSSGGNPLAIEDNPENIASTTDQANQSSIDEKKKRANLLKLCMVVGGLYVLYSKAQKIYWCSSVDLQSN